MFLPKNVAFCIDALEAAGFQAYAVGGCVRDWLLGITPHDYDLCTSALPKQLCQVFSDCRLVRSGEKHGTIGVVLDQDVIEITTFRTEGGYRDNRHPDWVRFVSDVKDDLARRDFTVNAMAYSPKEGLVDPWGGQADLRNRILRAVGDPAMRFSEDALRILRGVRFAARFSLVPEPKTQYAMFMLANSIRQLAKERVFDELCKLLLVANSQDLLRFAPVMAQAIPQLQPCMGFEQHTPYHAYDVFTHISHVVESAPKTLALRWAALLHDVGKPRCFTQDETGRGHFRGHAQISALLADEILLELKAPTALRQQVVFLVDHHMTPFDTDKRLMHRRLAKYGEENVLALLSLQEADMTSKGTGIHGESGKYSQLRLLADQILQEDSCLQIKDLAVDGKDLLALGFAAGPALGKCLENLLMQVIDLQLPNDKPALLAAAKDFLTEESL